jgi:hypothetical protein
MLSRWYGYVALCGDNAVCAIVYAALIMAVQSVQLQTQSLP